jgi:glycosyltransferase involved in cell wall biosynthesis
VSSPQSHDAKPTLLMVCAHEPTMDPRIRWEAESAVERFDVTVLGFNHKDRSLPPVEQVNGYRIVRLQQEDVGILQYYRHIKELIPNTVKLVAAALGIVLFPVLLVLEILARLLVAMLRLAGVAGGNESGNGQRLLTLSLLVRGLRIHKLAHFVRARLMPRFAYILAIMRMQFAPAAAQFWDYLLVEPIKPQVVHCNDLDTLLVGVLAKKHFGCRLVYDAHEYYPASDPHGGWLDVKFFGLIERFLIRRTDAAITVNPMLAGIMRKAYGLAWVYSVPNAEPWVEGRRLSPAAVRNTEMDRLAAGRVKFLFQGRFTPGRGIDELIDGWALVNGTRAALFLRGPHNTWRQAAIEQAKKLGLYGNSVFFLDAVTEDELVSAASEAHVGVIPYRPLIINDRFSCPNKLSQYLHAGLMILANDLPYVKSVVADADAGLSYDSNDLSTFAAAVEQIVVNPDLLGRCRENALRYARERFNWQAQAATMLDLYEGNIVEHDQDSPALGPTPAATAKLAT